METSMRTLLAFGVLTLVSTAAGAAWQEPAIPLYQAKQVMRSIPALNFIARHSTRIPMVNTSLLPDAGGYAVVDVHNGLTSIHLKLNGLIPAYSFGPEYLTYVLWAITPDGRPVNLSEIVPDHKGRCNLKVTTSLQSF